MKYLVTLMLLTSIAHAETSDELHKAIAAAEQAHAIVRNKKDAEENSQLLKQIDVLVTPLLARYASLKGNERDLLAEAMVLAAQSDSSYSLASEHLQALRHFENSFSKSIERLILQGRLTRAQADLFFNGLEIGDTSL